VAVFRLLPENPREAVVAVGASIVLCTLAVLAVDTAFRSTLTAQYVATFTGIHPWHTTLLMVSKAAKDELLGRVALVGGMLAIAGVVLRERELGPVALTAIFVTA
jgi:hypothetical protein